jgi:hypothetical protein
MTYASFTNLLGFTKLPAHSVDGNTAVPGRVGKGQWARPTRPIWFSGAPLHPAWSMVGASVLSEIRVTARIFLLARWTSGFTRSARSTLLRCAPAHLGAREQTLSSATISVGTQKCCRPVKRAIG